MINGNFEEVYYNLIKIIKDKYKTNQPENYIDCI